VNVKLRDRDRGKEREELLDRDIFGKKGEG
jgi:hypothetical protein